jgi:hypothetical protein
MLAKLNQGAAAGAGAGAVTIVLEPLLSRESTGNVKFADYSMGSLAIALFAIPRPAENILEAGLGGLLPKFTERTPFIYPIHLNTLVHFTGKTATFRNYRHLLTITQGGGLIPDIYKKYGLAGTVLESTGLIGLVGGYYYATYLIMFIGIGLTGALVTLPFGVILIIFAIFLLISPHIDYNKLGKSFSSDSSD